MPILHRMNTKPITATIAKAGLFALMTLVSSSAFAAATLKPEVQISSDIVTIGDMFHDAGSLADRALFRAPKTGTAGRVSIASITNALQKYGLANFDFDGLKFVTVERPGKILNAQDLRVALESHIRLRGIIEEDARIDLKFSQTLPNISYDTLNGAGPRILDLRISISGRFSVSFALSGQKQYFSTSGFMTELVQVPMLTKAMSRGDIVQPTDIGYEFIAKHRTSGFDIALLEDIVGQSLKSSKRAGALITNRDLEAPMLVRRNQMVALILKIGTLTLTAKGQALSNASEGGIVKVLNLKSKKIITGFASAPGTVTVGSSGARLASL